MYGRKKEENKYLLERIKDFSTLVPGQSYHLRKMISKDECIVYDDVYDVILKEFKDGILYEQDTDEQFLICPNEFEIFIYKNL